MFNDKEDTIVFRKLYWGLGVLIILIISATAFVVLKNKAEMRQLEKEFTDAEIQETQQPNRQSSTAESELTQAPADSTTPTAEKPITQIKPVRQTTEPAHMQTDAPVQAVEVTADTPISPFGFGPYPEVPDGLKAKKFVPSWSNHNWEKNPKKKWELFDRVLIKAWNEGQHWNGAIMEDGSGKIYLSVPGIVHVWYGYNTNPVDGTTHRYFTRVSGANLTPEQMDSGILPEGLIAIDGENAGIDPYKYLNISR